MKVLKSGRIILLKSSSFGTEWLFIIEAKNETTVLLSRPEKPFERLQCLQNGSVRYSDAPSKQSLWKIQSCGESNSNGPEEPSELVCIQSATGKGVYLSVNVDATLTSADLAQSPACDRPTDASFVFEMQLLPEDLPLAQLLAPIIPPSAPPKDTPASIAPPLPISSFLTSSSSSNSHELNPSQKLQLVQEGYVVVPGLVPTPAVEACVKRINRALGTPGELHPGGNQAGCGKLGGEISNCREVKNLLTSTQYPDHTRSVVSLLQSLLGKDNVMANRIPGAQIALRFPEQAPHPPYGCTNINEDLSTFPWHVDGLRQGKRHGFSLLVGVCLRDITEEYSGNFLVWPKTHLLIYRCLQGPYGDFDVVKLQKLLDKQRETDRVTSNTNECSIVDVSLSTVCRVDPCTHVHSVPQPERNSEPVHNNEPDDLPILGSPLSVLCKAGDVLLVHPDTPHAGGPNYSPNIRYMDVPSLCDLSRCLPADLIDVAFQQRVKSHQDDAFNVLAELIRSYEKGLCILVL